MGKIGVGNWKEEVNKGSGVPKYASSTGRSSTSEALGSKTALNMACIRGQHGTMAVPGGFFGILGRSWGCWFSWGYPGVSECSPGDHFIGYGLSCHQLDEVLRKIRVIST